MFEAHPDLSTPSDDTIIWRYLDLERFLGMLVTRQLFLCRLDKFKDPWEGTLPESTIAAIQNGFKEHAERLHEVSIEQRKTYFVSCWHESSTQSAALWDLYAARSGLAIQSTIGQLKAAINDTRRYFIGRVEYIDFETHISEEPYSFFIPVFLKRKSYEHEKEVRVMHWDLRKDEHGQLFTNFVPNLSLDIDINVLIQKLYISPSSPEWLVPAISELCNRFDIAAPIQRSTLLDSRIY